MTLIGAYLFFCYRFDLFLIFLGWIAVTVGLIFILHASYSVYEDRKFFESQGEKQVHITLMVFVLKN